jgi:tRNA G18 (ribose-2'-O)-methylase SpoU
MKAGILIGQLSDTRNESALIRTAEAFGINQVHAVNVSDGDISGSVARGAEGHVSIHHYDDYREFIARADRHNLSVVAVENAPGSVPIEEPIDYPANPVFVTGNEGAGCPKPIVESADVTVHITQSVNSYMRCLNTTVAGSLVMHDWFEHRYHRDKQQHEFTVPEGAADD